MATAATRAFSNAKRPSSPQPEINITPLVDVVLVLLIIFMVIAPALEHGERVELPAILHPDETHKNKEEPVTVTVSGSGRMFLEKEPLDLATLRTRLEALHGATPDRRVVLRGDSGAEYKQIREVFRTVQDVGFPGCALVVSKKKQAGEN